MSAEPRGNRPRSRRPSAPAGRPPAWLVPPILALIAVSIIGGFYLGGPGLGLAVGGLAAGTIVYLAARNPPRGPISPAPLQSFRRHLLVVLDAPLEDASVVAALAAPRDYGEPAPDVLLLAPTRSRFLDRWACDRNRAQSAAQRNLVMGVAALAKADVTARARLGDESPVQAVEDELRTYPATEVILISASAETDASAEEVAGELRARLQVDFCHLVAAEGRIQSLPQPSAKLA